MRALVLIVVCVVTAACVEDLTPATLIARNRVLGARVEVEADAARAWPRPGERAMVRWLVVDETEPRPVAWAFIACAPDPNVRTGVVPCAGAPLGVAQQLEAGAGPPTLTVDVPSAFAGESILVAGVICARGRIEVGSDPSDTRCTSGEAGQTLVTLSVHVQQGDDGNRNPDVNEVRIGMGEAPTETTDWPSASLEPPRTGCVPHEHPADFPLLAAAEVYAVRIADAEAARETFVDAETGEPTRETLQISQFATSGEIDRRFSILDDATPEVDFEWTAPAAADVPEDGLTVRFDFVFRDKRGGIAQLTKFACVGPAASPP